jgi:hypothetical protein
LEGKKSLSLTIQLFHTLDGVKKSIFFTLGRATFFHARASIFHARITFLMLQRLFNRRLRDQGSILCVCRLFAKTTEIKRKKKQYEIKRGKIHTRDEWMGAYLTYLNLYTGKDKQVIV